MPFFAFVVVFFFTGYPSVAGVSQLRRRGASLKLIISQAATLALPDVSRWNISPSFLRRLPATNV